MTNKLDFLKLHYELNAQKAEVIMDNILFEYFENRYKEAKNKLDLPKNFGPVITLSRQAGCEAKKVANQLVIELNKDNSGKPWTWVDKEILEKSAKELNLSQSKLEHFYEGHEKSQFIDMFIAFSRSHVNDMKIKNTIRDIILSICKQGNIILVGRGGAAILQDKPNVLNVRLTAPFFWRIDTIMENQKSSMEEAEEWAIDTDEKRHKLLYTFLEKQPVNLDFLFDATINRKNFSVAETADIIRYLAKKKGI